MYAWISLVSAVTSTVTVSIVYVIPKEVRDLLGLKPRQRLEVEVLSDGTLLVIPIPKNVIKAMRLPAAERLGRALIEERAEEEERAKAMAEELKTG